MADEKKPIESKKGESFLDVLTTNKWDAIAYVALFLGLLISVFERFIGGSIVGLILGFYFSDAVKASLVQFKEYLADEGIFKGFVLLAGALSLLIASPGLVMGSLLGAFIQPFIMNSTKPKK